MTEPRTIETMKADLAQAEAVVAELKAELAAAVAEINDAAVARARAIEIALASRPRRFDELIGRA